MTSAKSPDTVDEVERLIAETTGLIGAGRAEEALSTLMGALPLYGRDARLLTMAGHAALAVRDSLAAWRYFREAAETGSPIGREGLRGFLAKHAPHWHYFMLSDTARNTAFVQAIEQRVQPGMLVLDIGAGAGLLSLAAARAGARVVACEISPLIAAVAQEVVEANGLADRITIHCCHSGRLTVGKHLPEPADLLVTETFDGALLGEGALTAIHDAKMRLIKPRAAVIPGSAMVHAVLVESPALVARGSVGEVAGFDLSAFDRIAPPTVLHHLAPGDYRMLHAPVPVGRIEFQGHTQPNAKKVVPLKIAEDGRADAVLFWFKLTLADGISLGNGPEDGFSHWSQAACLLRPPVPMRAGSRRLLIANQTPQDYHFEVK
ncbi:MAG: 50S ribosomal protein L11 methyltransferase [Rhodothalassiaceae bacterium]